MVRKKAAPVQSEIQRHQIEVHEDHSKENDEYMHDFAGPVVFYEYFSQRTSENVLFRRKHTSFPIYFSKQASDERIHTRSKRKEWEIRIRNPSRRLGLLAAYLIKVQSTENNSGCAGCHVQMISSFYLDCISDGNELVTQFPFLKHDKQKSNMCLVFYYNTNEGHASSSIPIFIQVQSFIQAICHGLEFNSATANSYIAIVDLELHAMLRDQQAGTQFACTVLRYFFSATVSVSISAAAAATSIITTTTTTTTTTITTTSTTILVLQYQSLLTSTTSILIFSS